MCLAIVKGELVLAGLTYITWDDYHMTHAIFFVYHSMFVHAVVH